MEVKYYKGYSKDSASRRAVFAVYDEPKETLCDETYTVEATNLDETGITRFSTVEECEAKFYMSREIGEAEYSMYRKMQRIIEEMFQNQYTGGFPRPEVVLDSERQLSREIRNALTDMGFEADSRRARK